MCYFKYSYFFADILNQMLGTQIEVSNVAAKWLNGLTATSYFSVDKIILPVGISFYTFQIVSYTADVYKGLVKPVRNILDFGFYVSFFPQLVAGPIVKASDFIPQLYRKYFLSRRQFGIAIFWIVNGLVKKIILSDYLAVNFIDRVFDNPMLFTGFENLAALFLYSLQVYADFSGYTDIAIGLSMLMGFHLPRNFNSPYKAPNCSNFWKRWHISLSRWLQTYLYIPLGGNRKGKLRRELNILTVFLLSGLWHGNNWTFVLWGAYHALVYKLPVKYITFIAVLIGWVFFRAEDVGMAWGYLSHMFNPNWMAAPECSKMPLLLIALLVITEWLMKEATHPFQWKNQGWQSSQWIRMACYLIVFFATIMLGGEKVQFIYFQF